MTSKRSPCCVTIPLGVILAMLIAGCGPTLIKVPGRLLDNGQPRGAKGGERLIVTFYPDQAGGAKPLDGFPARVLKDGTFLVTGNARKGIPPGRYHVALDGAKGDLGTYKSPIIRDITNSDEIVIDISKPTG